MTGRRNPARARRDVQLPAAEGRVDWVTEPAHLTEGHFELADVKEAFRVVEDSPRRRTFLGRGNFGETYAVPVGDRLVVVKLPTEKDIHGRTWKLPEQRQNFLHEAGVANELQALGVTIVPETVYVETPDGIPALVREYGEPVTSMSLDDFIGVEQQLADVEALDWRVEDEIDLYARPDGTVFVGDVGIWHPIARYADSGKPRGMWEDESSLDDLVPRLGEKLLGPRYDRMPSLFAVGRSARWAAEALEELVEEPRRPLTGFQKHHLDLAVGSLREKIARRHALGLPVPPDALAVLQAATDLGL